MRRRVEEQIVLGKCVAGAAVPEHAGWVTPSLSVPDVEVASESVWWVIVVNVDQRGSLNKEP